MATTKKTATKKTAAKKTAAKKPAAKAAPVEAAEEESVESLFQRVQTNFKEIGTALAASNAIMSDRRREVLLTMIENAQENADATFDAVREVMDAESLSDSLRIQRDALREGIERNIAQVRGVASMTAEGGRDSISPVTDYISTLREKVKTGANA